MGRTYRGACRQAGACTENRSQIEDARAGATHHDPSAFVSFVKFVAKIFPAVLSARTRRLSLPLSASSASL